MCRRVVRTQVEEHKVLTVGAALHAPVFWLEGQRLHLQIFFLFGKREGVELCGARRIIFTQRVPFPGLRHHDARQVRVAIKGHAEHLPGFALVPVGVREDFGQRRQVQIVLRQRHLEHDVAVTFDRQKMVENGKIRGGQTGAVGTQTLIHAMQVIEHDVRFWQFTQESYDLQQLLALYPDHGKARTGRLNGKGIRPKTVTQLADHRVIQVIPGLPCRLSEIVRG